MCLILTLLIAAASAFATPATRAYRRTPALAPEHKPAHAAAKARPAKAAKSASRTSAKATANRKAPPAKAVSAKAAKGKGSRAADRASIRSSKQTTAKSSARVTSRAANRITTRGTARTRREQARRRLLPAVRNCRRCTPEPRIETASLHTSRPRPIVEPRPEPELKPVPAPAAASVPTPALKFDPYALKPGDPMPAPLRGTAESLQRQNERTDQDGLERILDEEDLSHRIQLKALVPVPTSSALAVNDNLSDTHRYCRPWTASFLTDLSKAYSARFQKPIQVTSAVRTVEYQKQLMRVNGNATAAEGDVVSPHLTGATIDIGKNGMSKQEIAWMRNKLMALQQAGKLDVAEEFRQPCFHITVYKDYALSPASPHKASGTQQVAQTQPQIQSQPQSQLHSAGQAPKK